VAQRTQEIGVRLAIGANARDVVVLFVRRGLLLTTVGLFGGAILAAGASGLIESFVAGISAHDPVTYVAVIGVVTGFALLGSYLPARRVAGVDPASTLRSE
jgi:ABC-type antimicrobial peptide transport system permease subunit